MGNRQWQVQSCDKGQVEFRVIKDTEAMNPRRGVAAVSAATTGRNGVTKQEMGQNQREKLRCNISLDGRSIVSFAVASCAVILNEFYFLVGS